MGQVSGRVLVVWSWRVLFGTGHISIVTQIQNLIIFGSTRRLRDERCDSVLFKYFIRSGDRLGCARQRVKGTGRECRRALLARSVAARTWEALRARDPLLHVEVLHVPEQVISRFLDSMFTNLAAASQASRANETNAIPASPFSAAR